MIESNSSYPHRVLVVGPSASLGGIASVMRRHAATRLWKSANCRLLSTYDERNSFTKVLSALRAYIVSPFLIWRSTLVHVHVAAQKSMIRKLPIILLTKVMRKPFIIHLHAASEASLFEQTPSWITRLAFLLSYRVIVLSESWASTVTKHIPHARVSVIYNPIAMPRLSAASEVNARPMILFAGKLEARKGYMDLLEAAANVLDQFPNVELRLVGHGEIAQAKEHARQLGIENSVTCTGWTNPEQMEEHFRAASIFCLPSYDEGLPMAVLEAMSFSLPVVATPVGGLPEILSDGQNGLFAQVGNVESLTSQLLLLLRQPAFGAVLGINASQTIARLCSIEHIERQLEDLYCEVNAEWILRRKGLREISQVANQ
jgi:glycosyltransferase involved in cell wall biosynthesis